MRELEVRQGIVSMMNMIDFMIRGCYAMPNADLMAQGSALARNVIQYMARRTCFKEQYYTDTIRYICVREDCWRYQAETIHDFVMFFHQYLKIGEFVWDLVLLGTRYYQSASVDCSGVIQKIRMREIEVEQGFACMMKMIDFMLRAVRQARIYVSEARGLR